MLAELRRVFLPPEHKLWTLDCDVDQNGSCSRDEISFLLLRICHHWHLFCDARRLQSNCQSNDVWSGWGDYFDKSAFCKLESNNSINCTTSGRAGISWVCIIKRWSIDCIAKVRELIGVSKRKVKADYDVVDALHCTCNRGSVSKCQRIKGTTHLASPRQPFYFQTIYCRHVYFGGGLLVSSYSSARKQCKGWYCWSSIGFD